MTDRKQFKLQTMFSSNNKIYRVFQKKYTNLKSKIFALRIDQSIKLVSFVREVHNLDFDT